MSDGRETFDYWQGIAKQPSPHNIPQVSSGKRIKRHKLPIVLTEYPTGETTVTVNGTEYFGVGEKELLDLVQAYLIGKVETKAEQTKPKPTR